ncbi:MAG: 4Fe-4S cluster-binding domain-containing protein [Patescibacteria group bacterium]|nr:4Fe-4S cluster-binding domain-containing protein [Patescibacteria group bacterium]
MEHQLYRRLGEKKIQCLACQRNCLVNDQQVGFCLARQNIGGELKPLTYGQITGIQADPIEKKPFYHFKPGTTVATIGSYGCNFRCKQCLNFSTTWGATKELRSLQTTDYRLRQTKPQQIVEEIINAGYQGIAFSYNEPTTWAEFAAEIAKEFKLRFSSQLTTTSRPTTHFSSSQPFAVFVTNGSWTKETIDLLTSPVPSSPRGTRDTRGTLDTPLVPLIDAANIDIKGFCEETYKKQGAFLGTIPEMAVYAQKKGIFLELTTLLIPTINDDPEEIKMISEWIVKSLGPDTPWHLSQFDPDLAPEPSFQKIPPTPPELLEKAAEIGREQGLSHLYIWAPNSGGSVSETICPNCKNVVIHRLGWEPKALKIDPNGRCEFCGYRLNVVL